MIKFHKIKNNSSDKSNSAYYFYLKIKGREYLFTGKALTTAEIRARISKNFISSGLFWATVRNFLTMAFIFASGYIFGKIW